MIGLINVIRLITGVSYGCVVRSDGGEVIYQLCAETIGSDERGDLLVSTSEGQRSKGSVFP
jgi:hypothetical protein